MSEMPRRLLGGTGEEISLVGLGGAHIGKLQDEEESVRIVRTAIDNGINFMDNSWDYHDGTSEVRMGRALRDGYRDKVFLMTKIDGQSRDTALKQLDESLKRLQTDTIDLLQFHEVIRDSDPDYILAPGNALDALVEAREAGKIRYIGFTGHKSPDIHLKMFRGAQERGFTFDTVQMPVNIIDAHYNSFEKKLAPMLLQNNVGILAMKPLCSGIAPKSGIATAEECLRYAMSSPASTVITGCESLSDLEQVLQVARRFVPMSTEEREGLLARIAGLSDKEQYEPWKNTEDYDATNKNPHWLGREEQ
jgi:aryl-alcohol dehydrogenase-like predicted oxidoreductase